MFTYVRLIINLIAICGLLILVHMPASAQITAESSETIEAE